MNPKGTYLVAACAALLAWSLPAAAQFSGAYAPSQWTTVLEGDPPGGGGPVGVDVSSAPASILIIGGDDASSPGNGKAARGFHAKGGGGCLGPSVPNPEGERDGAEPSGSIGSFGCWIDYLTTAQGSGTVSFRWDYDASDDGPEYELFGYVLNGVFVQLSENQGDVLQDGVATFPVSAGDEFGFRHDCTDCCCGGAFVTISAFSAPLGTPPLPEPRAVPAIGWTSGLLMALGVLLLGVAVLRRGG
jgi:hypothetical protein